MASLVLGVAGAAVGTFFGAPQVGWMIGSTLGTLLDPQVTKSEGPRLGDAQITSSTLGTAMAVMYGTGRLAGNVIQASKIREVATTESQGKGGPSSESTTYSYNVDVAIDLCAGVAKGIRKIWTDGKLTYDISTDVDAGSGIASTSGAVGFTFYPGTETQLPDPTLEAITGVGATPAYRGRCYVVFSQLACPGGRIPQLTFEVLRNGAESFAMSEFAPYAGGQWAISKDVAFEYTVAAGPVMTVTKRGPGYVEWVRDHSVAWPTPYGQQSGYTAAAVDSTELGDDVFYVTQGQSEPVGFGYTNQVRSISLSNGASRELLAYGSGADFIRAASSLGYSSAYDVQSESFGVMAYTGYYTHTLPQNAALANDGLTFAVAARRGLLYAVQYLDPVTSVNVVAMDGTPIDSIVIPLSVSGPDYSLFVAEDTGYIYLLSGTGLHRYNGTSWATLASGFIAPTVIHAPFYANEDYAILGPAVSGSLANSFRLLRYRALVDSPPLVSDIITDQCARSGIPSSKLSFVGVTDTVAGYPVARVSSARANIEPLQKAFFIDAAEVDLKLVFTKRTAQPVTAVVPFEELAAAEDGSEAGDPFPLVRAQEEEFPRSVTVSYIDTASDYQSGAEASRRQVTKSINDVSDAIAICTTSAHAKQVAEVLLFDAWNVRNKRSGKLTRKYAYLTPGDVVPIEYPVGTVQNRLLTRVADTGLLIEFDAVDANADLYQVTPPGSSGGMGQEVTPLPPPTNMALLDVPMLRDADNDAGLYVALSAAGPNWRGATLYVGNDDSTMVADGGVSTSSPIGFAGTTLGPWISTTVDERNTLVVSMGVHMLSSTTRNAMLDGGINTFALGVPGRWEIGQFTRAVSLGDGRYELSGLLRGLRGTEANRGTHGAGETFVLLVAAGMTRPAFDVSQLNHSRRFRAVTSGRSFAESTSYEATNTGAALKPFSPINVRSQRLDNGDIRFTWDRRTRLSSNWLLGVMPLGEASSAFEVDIVIGGQVKRTLSSVTASVDYALVDQFGDAGMAVTSVTAVVYQMSEVVGRGFPSLAAFAVAPQPGGSAFPGGSSINLYPAVTAPGVLTATSKAVYGDNTAYKIFESSNNGVSFTQLAGAGAPISAFPFAVAALDNGTYISFQAENISDVSQTDFYITRGAAGVAPTVTPTKFTRPYLPVALGSDGTKFAVMTQGNQVFTSTDGVTFTARGTASGLPTAFAQSGGLTNYGSGSPLVWAANRWFIIPAGGRVMYYTTDANATTGWTACTLPTATAPDYYFPQFYRMAQLSGALFISALRFHVDSNVSVIFKSTDSGSTWTVALDPAVGSFSDVWNLGGRLVAVAYDFTGKTNVSTDGGTTWTTPSNGLAYVDRKYPVQAGNTLIVAAGRVGGAAGSAPQELRYTTDGVTFTNSAGI